MGPEDFLRLSLNASLFLAGLVSFLTVGLMISKRLRRAWRAYSERRSSVFLPRILQAIAREAGVAHESVFKDGRRPGDWGIVEAALFRWQKTAGGHGREGLYHIFHEDGFADYEIRRLRSLRWWVRAQAARRLGQMLCVKAVPELIGRLRDPSLEVRLVAARALGQIGEVRAVEEIVHALSTHSRLAALSLTHVIYELGDRSVPVLRDLLARPDVPTQILAIQLLSQMRDKAAAPLIEPFLQSSQPDAKVAACQALAELGEPAVGPRLALVLKDAAWEVRAKAAWALGRLRCEQSVPELAARLGDEAWWVRYHAGGALARLGERGRATLADCLSHQDRFARDMAAQWLDELSSGRVR